MGLERMQVGDTLSHYVMEELLGQGGMGAVFKARDSRDGRQVAVKVMSAEGALERFKVEADTLSQLHHPGIPEVFEFGLEPAPYLVQEIVEGPSLESRLSGPLPLDQAVHFGLGLLDVLRVVHQGGFVHRDLTPSNVLLRGDQVCLIDFGLVVVLDNGARLTTSGEILGTPEYMTPEQIDPKQGQISPRTDLFAVGTILYRMLTGKLPTLPGSYPKVMRQVVKEPPIPPEGLSAELTQVVLKALEKRPENRFSSAEEFAAALKAAGQGGN